MAGVCLSYLKAGSPGLLVGVSLFAATLSGADSNEIQSDVSFTSAETVSYTHLTLPTILLV